MSQIAEAFERAGYQPAEEVVRRMMTEAIRDGLGMEAKCLAIFERALRKAEPALLHRALVGDQTMRSAALRLFSDIRNEMRREQASRRGHDTRAPTAGLLSRAVTAKPKPQDEAKWTAPEMPGRERHASPAAPELPGGLFHRARETAGRVRRAAGQPYQPSGAVTAVVSNLYLDRMIDGKPVRNWKAGHALTYAFHSIRDGFFMRNMAQGLTPEMCLGVKSEEDAALAYQLAAAVAAEKSNA